jgi:CRISPR-associated protein Cas2
MERENYFFTIDEEIDYGRSLILIIYDIIDNKKRNKFSKLLEGYGNRVQKSAFEAKLTKKQYDKLISIIPKYCDESDSIRVYKLSGKCQVTCWGCQDITDEDDIVVI